MLICKCQTLTVSTINPKLNNTTVIDVSGLPSASYLFKVNLIKELPRVCLLKKTYNLKPP
jgi:hypothetical protein